MLINFKKTGICSLITFGLIGSLAACAKGGGSASPSEPAQTTTKTADTPIVPTLTATPFEYRFKGEKCETHKRSFRTLDELCLNLQLDANNAACAADQREAHFKKLCAPREWKPVAAVDQLLRASDLTVKCYFGEDHPTLPELISGEKYLVEQISSSETMVLKHEHTSAVVKQSLADETYSMSIQIFDGAGKLVKEVADSWPLVDLGLLDLRVKDAEHSPEISCHPNVRKKD